MYNGTNSYEICNRVMLRLEYISEQFARQVTMLLTD